MQSGADDGEANAMDIDNDNEGDKSLPLELRHAQVAADLSTKEREITDCMQCLAKGHVAALHRPENKKTIWPKSMLPGRPRKLASQAAGSLRQEWSEESSTESN